MKSGMAKRIGNIMLALLLWLPMSAMALESGMQTKINALMERMTIEQKICQLFFVRPEDFSRISSVTKASQKLENAYTKYPVGGVTLFSDNIKSEGQLTKLNSALQGYASRAGIGLFIGVDEEGGGVARVANSLNKSDAPPVMSEIGKEGDPEAAYAVGAQMGSYLKEYGFTLNFAPVADIRTDIQKAEITGRSFGYDEEIVSQMTERFVTGLQQQGVLAVLKHFLGHGSVTGNSHNGKAVSTRTTAQWRACEWLPFQAGIAAGARMVMMSHQTAIAVDSAQPASLSNKIVTELLRGELGFDGVVITDALRMDAVANEYKSGDACVAAILAGCDMLLLPKNFSNAYNGMLEAINDGRLSEERVDESVRRILTLKAEWGLLDSPAAE